MQDFDEEEMLFLRQNVVLNNIDGEIVIVKITADIIGDHIGTHYGDHDGHHYGKHDGNHIVSKEAES